MKRSCIRKISLIMVFLYLAGCGSTTTTQALGIHSSNDMRNIKIDERQTYEIKLVDGTSHMVYGDALRLHEDLVQAYEYNLDQWMQYTKPQVEDIYLRIDDKQKQERKFYWKTGLAVLAAFAAATAGGYFIQKELR